MSDSAPEKNESKMKVAAFTFYTSKEGWRGKRPFIFNLYKGHTVRGRASGLHERLCNRGVFDLADQLGCHINGKFEAVAVAKESHLHHAAV